ncbi:MAG: hypothetical protein KGN38_04805 [Actinomycetales bacterium]|nr:hypothetical protein [Actinomycetales bacterium]
MDSTSTQSAQAAAESGTAAATPEQRRSWMQGPLPEVIGYVGGALVASAGLNFIAQSWETWSFITRVYVVGTALAVLYAAAGAVIGIAGGRAALESPEKANRRRLTAVLMALAAVLVGALTAVIIDHQGWMDFEDSTWWIVLPGALALLAAGVGAWFAPGAVSTLAVAATSAWTGVALTMKIAVDQPAWWVPVLITAFGAVWLAVAPRLLRAPELSESLGMAWLLLFLGPAALADLADPSMGATDDQVAAVWVSRGMLTVIALVALTLFARGASWAWAVGGVIAAVMAAMAFAGQALGWVAALLVAGVVLLACSGLLLALRRRSDRAPTS